MAETDPNAGAITSLLGAWADGDQTALEKLTPLVYAELRRRARDYMARERGGHTLQPTALVNEVFVRLVQSDGLRPHDRVHFYALSAQMMRRILISAARARDAGKRGGHDLRVTLDDEASGTGRDADLVRLDDALEELVKLDPRKARVVELRFFGGLTVEETAEVLNISAESVHRDWRFAKSWLTRELRG